MSTTKLIESFEDETQWTIIAAASGIAADTTHFLSGTQGVKYNKGTSSDKAGIYKPFASPKDLGRFDRNNANIYIPSADLSKIKNFDVIFDCSASPSYTFWDWDSGGNYTCDVEPQVWAPTPWTLVGTDFGTVTAGILRIANAGANSCYYLFNQADLWTTGEWGQAPLDYNWGVVKAKCKVDSGIPVRQCSLEIDYAGVEVKLHVEDGQLRIYDSSGEFTVVHDTTSDYSIYEIYISQADNYYYVLANGSVVAQGQPNISGTGYRLAFGANITGANNTNLGQDWDYVRWGEIHKDASFARYKLPVSGFSGDQ